MSSCRSTRSTGRVKAIVSFDAESQASNTTTTTTTTTSSSRRGASGRGRGRSRKNAPSTPSEDHNGQHNGRVVDGDGGEERPLTMDQDALVRSLVRYVLLHEHTKSLLKYADMSKYLTECHQLTREQITVLIKECIKRLKDIFGIDLVEHTETGGKCFILHSRFSMHDVLMLDAEQVESRYEIVNGVVPVRSPGEAGIQEVSLVSSSESSFYTDEEHNAQHGRRALMSDDDDGHGDSEDDDDDEDYLREFDPSLTLSMINAGSRRGLLLVTLSILFMNEDEPLPEADLFSLFRTLGLNVDANIATGRESHRTTIKKILNEDFVRRAYLRRNRVRPQEAGGPVTYNYEWGPRSIVEFKKGDILRFVQHIYQVDDDTMWHSHEKRAEQSDQARQERIDKVTSGGSSSSSGSSRRGSTQPNGTRVNGGNDDDDDDDHEEDDDYNGHNGVIISSQRSTRSSQRPQQQQQKKKNTKKRKQPDSPVEHNNNDHDDDDDDEEEEEEQPKPKKPRGRPPKTPKGGRRR